MTDHGELDHVTGKTTTGHEWDGIKELNTPLPRWWLITFYATIIWAIGYWIVYPAWPLLWSHTTGILQLLFARRCRRRTRQPGKDPRRQDGRAGDAHRSPRSRRIRRCWRCARARGKTVFGDNCAPCHGSGGAGAKGYPNLNDDDWLWGGTLDQIMQTIQFGARSGHAEDP